MHEVYLISISNERAAFLLYSQDHLSINVIEDCLKRDSNKPKHFSLGYAWVFPILTYIYSALHIILHTRILHQFKVFYH